MIARRHLRPLLLAALPLAGLGAAACGDANQDAVGESSEEALLSCGSVVTPEVSRSLFVTDATALAGFSLKSVMDQITETGSTTGQTSLGLYQQLMDTMNDKAHAVTKGPHCDDDGGKVNGFPVDCPRGEGNLAKTNPFGTDGNSYVPLGLVNRFDLAPKNGANCGQYRVVFGKISGKTNAIDRVLIIFEAVLPNPTPAKGLAACTPVAEFWDSLTSDASATSRASKLKNFYFKGLTGFAPVISAAHYGIGNGTNTGQIRANMFFNDDGPVEWQLREFHLSQTCTTETDGGKKCTLLANNVGVQDNPFGGLFGCSSGSSLPNDEALAFSESPNEPIEGDGGSIEVDASPPPPPKDGGSGSGDAGVTHDAGTGDGGSGDAGPGDGGTGTCNNAAALAFQKQFLKQVSALSSTSLNGITMTTPNVDNAGQSSEQDSTNDYLQQGGSNAALLASITATLPKGSALTAENMLDRATTQSCAGCHEVSVGRNLGGGLVWPQSNGFTQIDESSNLSPALTGTFLPFRAKVLKAFLDTQCSSAAPASPGDDDSETTIGGSAVGSAN